MSTENSGIRHFLRVAGLSLAACSAPGAGRVHGPVPAASANALLNCARLAVQAEGFEPLARITPPSPGTFTARRTHSLGPEAERREFILVWVARNADSLWIGTDAWQSDSTSAGNRHARASPGLAAIAARLGTTCPPRATTTE